MDSRKEAIIAALRRFVAQRPGMEFGNYGDVKSYRAELRTITRDRHDAERLLDAVENNDAITADDLIEAFPGAFSGRLQLLHKPVNRTDRTRVGRGDDISAGFVLDYCTGQYFPTEYRKAVAAVCAAALWEAQRNELPHTEQREVFSKDAPDGESYLTYKAHNGKYLRAGDWLRTSFRHWFGRSIQQRWFN